jgi:hypothetical protein
VTLVGCGSSAAVPPPRRTILRPTTPTLAQQIRLAERSGPGFLDYCALQDGRVSAYFTLDLPGAPVVDGWCQTQADRVGSYDRVTFQAHWVGQPILPHGGTVTMTFHVLRDCSDVTLGCSPLISQSGELPP